MNALITIARERLQSLAQNNRRPSAVICSCDKNGDKITVTFFMLCTKPTEFVVASRFTLEREYNLEGAYVFATSSDTFGAEWTNGYVRAVCSYNGSTTRSSQRAGVDKFTKEIGTNPMDFAGLFRAHFYMTDSALMRIVLDSM